ncbi:unnamed protein product [Prunus brigantina]
MVDEHEDDAKLASSNSRSLNYLKQQLRVAWSHNPLNTLKLICNLYSGKRTTIVKACLTREGGVRLRDGDLGEAAELQWKAMVQKHKEGGKSKEQSPDGSQAQQPQQHQLLLPQPPHLYSLLGDDLKSNLSFLKRMDFGIVMDLEKIFDLILQVAVKEDLKPEQMIKKLFVFTYCIPSRLYDSCAWETKGDSFGWLAQQFGPHHHLMEAAIADKEYQTLAVVD